MERSAVATNDSVTVEFTNDGGSYLATLHVRPKARPDGALVVNTEVELFVRVSDEDGADRWSEATVSGAVYEFEPNQERCGGGVGIGLADGSAHLGVTWSGERRDGSGVRLTEVVTRLSR